ncbi:MAG: hypothetical protein GYA50_07570 [Eubacteriaceae bacterium]|nr:hypothetical protein [Eubacteriaceae bacterium]
MYTQQQSKKSSLFLMELIIVLFFFALCSAVCVNIFAKAKLINEQSYELNKSVIAAQNAAQCFKAADSDITKLADLLNGTAEGNTLKIGYDKNWQNSELTNAVNIMTINIKISKDNLDKAYITIFKADKVIYSLEVNHLRNTQ